MAQYIYIGPAGSNPDLGYLTPGQALDGAAIAPDVIAKFIQGGLLEPVPPSQPSPLGEKVPEGRIGASATKISKE